MMPATDLTPVDRVLNALGQAGCNPRQARAGQWTARCPVAQSHKGGDKNPSLSIAEGAEGKALVTCHRGCTLPEIAEALRLGLRDLFPKRDKVTDLEHKRIVATYAYTDADGELLYEVVRYRPKDFRQRRRDDQGNWVWSIASIPEDARPLYQLPQVIRAVREGRTVWVVEGEKDAENLQWEIPVGDVATTNSGGAAYWRPHHSETLRNANVVIVPDNDGPGRLRAANIFSALAGVARHVKVLVVPDGSKDPTDALRNGHGPERWRPATDNELVDWIGATPEPPTEPDAPIVLDWGEFWRTDHATEDWLIEPLLPTGRAVAIWAPAKTGKSLVLLSAVAAACTGRSVWGLPARPPVRILYLDYEMTPADLKERLELLGYGPDDDLSNLRYALIPSLPPLDTAEGGQALLELAQAEDVQGVIADTFGRATQGDENDADTLRAYYRHTGSLLKKHGIASGRLDHAGKDVERGQRGTSAKNDDVDVVWRLSRTDDGVGLLRTHSRMTWVPERIDLIRHESPDGIWEFRRNAILSAGWPAGTKEAASVLDEADAPLDISTRSAAEILRQVGHKCANKVLRSALKYRKQVAENLPGPVDNYPKSAPGAVRSAESGAVTGRATARSELPAETPGARTAARSGAVAAAQRGATASLDAGAPRAEPGAPVDNEPLY